MSKKDFIALADAIRRHNKTSETESIPAFTPEHLYTLANFCQNQNALFKRDRWLDYIAGNCGPGGGRVKS